VNAPATVPDPPKCSLCGRGRRFRRTLCRCCYRKLVQCNIPLPPAAPPGPSLSLEQVLVLWLLRSPAVRETMAAALAKAGTGEQS
jgi:hypothetical protein